MIGCQTHDTVADRVRSYELLAQERGRPSQPAPRFWQVSGLVKPEQWLPGDAQPTSAEVTLAQLRMPELTIADIEQAEADSLKYRHE